MEEVSSCLCCEGEKVWSKVEIVAWTKEKKNKPYEAALKSDRIAGDRADGVLEMAASVEMWNFCPRLSLNTPG